MSNYLQTICSPVYLLDGHSLGNKSRRGGPELNRYLSVPVGAGRGFFLYVKSQSFSIVT